jgi:hypothetical protein
MGMGAGNVMDRMAASLGELTAVEPVFQAVSDVPNGGVLFALPALLAVGLLHQAHKYFQLPKGALVQFACIDNIMILKKLWC